MLKNFLKVGIGGAGSQAINFLALPVISRLYEPKEYAIWAIMIASSSIIGSIACLRYELAIVLSVDDKEASSLFWACLLFSAIFSVMAVFLIADPEIQKVIIGKNETINFRYALILPLFIFLTGLNNALQYWCVRKMAFLLTSVALIGQAIGTIAVQIGWALLFTATSIGLISGTLFGNFIFTMIIISGLFLAHQKPIISAKTIYNIPDSLKRHKLFLLYSTPFTIFGVLRDRATVNILNIFLNFRIVGLYAFSYRILNSPVVLISGALRPVLFQQAASEGVKSLESRLNMILKNLAILSMPFFVFYLYYPEDIFKVIFGSKWTESGIIGVYLIWPAYTFLFCNWMDRILDVLSRQKLALILELIFSVLSLTSLVAAFLAGLSIYKALFIQCAILVIYSMVYIYATYKSAGYKIRPVVNLLVFMLTLGVIEWLFLKMGTLFIGEKIGLITYIVGNVAYFSIALRRYIMGHDKVKPKYQ